MNIYNSLSRVKEEFVPRVAGKLSFYVCGPTVYDNAHLGHGRSAVAFDVIRRYFIYKGYEVNYVSNYTDIDDKMIQRALREGISVRDLADRVIPEYGSDYGALNVLRPDMQPLATEYVREMVDLVKVLEEKGFTYVLDDGVYYEVSRFEGYGKLSGNSLEDLQAGARVEVKSGKRSAQDFVLWKFRKEGEDDFWASPWGDGRPGWHIECSAMTRACLGHGFDIHGGGLDLTFPHHECEIAQSEAAFGEGSFAKYWMHNGFINVDDVKMSKSLNNFFTLKEIFEKYDAVVVRFMFLQTHYRNPVNFSDVLLDQAKAALRRLHTLRDMLLRVADCAGVLSGGFVAVLEDSRNDFVRFMDEDFDTSGVLGVLFDLLKFLNKRFAEGELLPVEASAALDLLREFDEVLAVIFTDVEKEVDEVFSEKVEVLLKKRAEAREGKDYAAADAVRDELKGMGVEIEDGSDGVVWRRV